MQIDAHSWKMEFLSLCRVCTLSSWVTDRRNHPCRMPGLQVFMLEFWKRKQKRYNLEWGMHGTLHRVIFEPCLEVQHVLHMVEMRSSVQLVAVNQEGH